MRNVVGVFFVLAISVSLFAQTPQHKLTIGAGAWWRNPDFASELKLTDTQIKEFEQSFAQHSLNLSDANAVVQREVAKVDSLQQGDADVQALLDQANKVIDARCRFAREEAQMYFEARRILTLEQWHKMQSLRAAMRYESAPSAAPKK